MIDAVDMDRLIETHCADEDPAFHSEDELENQKERFRERTMNYIETQIYHLIASLDSDECEVAMDCYDQICEYIYEQLER